MRRFWPYVVTMVIGGLIGAQVLTRADHGTVAFGAHGADGALRSHGAVRRVQLIGSNGPVAASLVGVVATDPEARGARLASDLLATLETAELETCALPGCWVAEGSVLRIRSSAGRLVAR